MTKRFPILKTITSAAVLAALCLSGARASELSDVASALADADVVILGEVHDNADHHLQQAALLEELRPVAVVWEMITQVQADRLDVTRLEQAEYVADHLGWQHSGWPDFDLYAPVFAAAVGAAQFGAQVPRRDMATALEQGIVSYFGNTAAARFGLDLPLPEAEQAAREAEQQANHCNAMPDEMLPLLVDAQRLRDASLAAAADRALAAHGGPVVVITGNGHARLDRGMAVYLAQARPDVQIRSLGQSENGEISGSFDLLLDAPAPDRPDPCLAFRGKG